MEVFLSVALSKNLAKAAEILNVTPSHVSKELKNLEDELGMLLVDRRKGVKTTSLTPAGEAFLPLALKWQEIQKEIENSRVKQQSYFLNMAGCETANNNLLPNVFNDLLNNSPPVLLKITTDPTDMLYERVETREVDVAFVVHKEISKYVSITPMHEDEMVVVCCEEGTDARREDEELGVVFPHDLDPKEELFIQWSQEFRLWHDSVWRPDAPLRAQLLTAYLIPTMLDRRGRWSIVPRCLMKDYANMGSSIRFYRLSVPVPNLIYYRITHRSPKISAIRGLEILDGILREHGYFSMAKG